MVTLAGTRQYRVVVPQYPVFFGYYGTTDGTMVLQQQYHSTVVPVGYYGTMQYPWVLWQYPRVLRYYRVLQGTTGTTVLQTGTMQYPWVLYSTQNRVLQGTTGIRSRRNEQVKAYILYIYIMVLQDTDLKNPEKTRQGKASKRREDQRRQGKQKMARASRFFLLQSRALGIRGYGKGLGLRFRLRVKGQVQGQGSGSGSGSGFRFKVRVKVQGQG